VFDDRIWVIGGSWSIPQFNPSDVWSSADGINWTCETAGAPWGSRLASAVTVFRNRIVLCGGNDIGGQGQNDVWSYGLHMATAAQTGPGMELPRGVVNVPYNAAIEAVVGDGPYTWAHTGGALPPGLAFGASTGDSVAVSGTPTALGTYTFTVKVTDSTGNFDEQVVSLTITKINQSGANSSPGCAAAPNGLPAATLATAMALFAILPRRRRALNKPA
jgi:hypothetical protein